MYGPDSVAPTTSIEFLARQSASRVIRSVHLPLFGTRASETTLQVHDQHRDRRGRDAGNPRCLPYGLWALLIQLLLRLRRKAAYLAVIHIRWKLQAFILLLARDLFLLAPDVTLVFGLYLDLLANAFIRHPGTGAGQSHELRIPHIRPSQQIRQCVLPL